jgi:hypothetical protein
MKSISSEQEKKRVFYFHASREGGGEGEKWWMRVNTE